MIDNTDVGKKINVAPQMGNLYGQKVRLLQIRPDGYYRVALDNGNEMVLAPHLLIKEEPSLLDKILDTASTEKSIQTMSKIYMEGVAEDGSIVKQTLEGEDVIKWYEFIRSLSIFADSHQMNPAFHTLKWQKIIEKPIDK